MKLKRWRQTHLITERSGQHVVTLEIRPNHIIRKINTKMSVERYLNERYANLTGDKQVAREWRVQFSNMVVRLGLILKLLVTIAYMIWRLWKCSSYLRSASLYCMIRSLIQLFLTVWENTNWAFPSFLKTKHILYNHG